MVTEVSVGFDPTAYTVPEGGTAELTIVRIGDAEEPVVVTVTSSDGSAEGIQSIVVVFSTNGLICQIFLQVVLITNH